MNLAQKAFLIIILEVLLGLPALMPKTKEEGFKSQDQYWAESDLRETDLLALLEDQNCYSNEKKFLGCANALLLAAERYRYTLELKQKDENLKVIWHAHEKMNFQKTEKERLATWQKNIPELMSYPTISFLQAWNQLRTHMIQSEELKAVTAKAINGYLSVVEDPHSYIIPVSMYKDIYDKNDLYHNYLGWVYQKTAEGLQVRKVFPKSLSAKVGLKKGDLILEINEQTPSSFASAELYETLNMVNKRRMSFLVQRSVQGKSKKMQIDVIKNEFHYSLVEAHSLDADPRAAVLTIHKFSQGVCAQAEKQIKSLMQDNLQGLIVDLRDNPGGRVDEAACLLNLFFPKETALFQMEFLNSKKNPEQYVAGQEQVYKGKVVVLVNGGSASASEIVAGVIKDSGRGTIVGERTFGKGTFQDGEYWTSSNNVAFFRTQGVYVFQSGWSAQLNGIEPDRIVADHMAPVLSERDLYMNVIQKGAVSQVAINQKQIFSRVAGIGFADLCANPSMDEDPQVNEAAASLFCGGF